MGKTPGISLASPDGRTVHPAGPRTPADEADNYPLVMWWQTAVAPGDTYDTILRAASGRGLLCHSERIREHWHVYRDAFNDDTPTTHTRRFVEIQESNNHERYWRNWHRDKTYYLIELPRIARLAHLMFLVMHLYRREDNWPMPFTPGLLIHATEWSNAVGFAKLEAHMRPELCKLMAEGELEATLRIYLLSKRIPRDERLNRAIDRFFESRRRLEDEAPGGDRGEELRAARLEVARRVFNGATSEQREEIKELIQRYNRLER
ncbi:hypothetical protein TKK_0007726 [Trichogramma kaykai]|uniref:Uncharacterized protein n=1 Tax=Trichogramma kaykai TaxID=54128 RepID=A0ABD2X874_9HYME